MSLALPLTSLHAKESLAAAPRSKVLLKAERPEPHTATSLAEELNRKEPLAAEQTLVPTGELALPVDEIPSVQFALELTLKSPVFATYFDRSEVLEALRDSLTEPVLFPPVRTDSFDAFCASYLTERVVTRPNWLSLLFRKSRFDLLLRICECNPESCREVLPYIDSLPLTVFQAIWCAIGGEAELAQVLLSNLLQTFEKEDRVFYALRRREIAPEKAYALCLASVCTAPLVFAELATKWPEAADRVVQDGISFTLEVTPEELANFEQSLLLTQGDAIGAQSFSRQFLEQCLRLPFQYERMMTAWGFFRRHHDPADTAVLSSLLTHLRKDNRLWFVHNPLYFYNQSL